MNIRIFVSFFHIFTALMILSSFVCAEGGRHIDPLQAISMGGGHDNPTHSKPRSSARPARHFSPLDAMNGRMVVKEDRSETLTKTKYKISKKLKNNSFSKQQANRRKKPSIQSNAIEYRIENAESGIEESDTEAGQEAIGGQNRFGDNTLKSLGFRKHNSPSNTSVPKPTETQVRQAVSTNVQSSSSSSHHKQNTQANRTDIAHIQVDDDLGSESPNGDLLKILMESQKLPGAKNSLSPSQKTHKNPTHQNRSKKILYLTFDDGPCRGTANVLRILKEEGINATMFYIGRNVSKSPSLFHKALSMPNILVSNHTYSHANGHYRRFYSSPVQNVVYDIDRAQQLIGGAKYLRLCGRNVWRLPHVKRNDHGIKTAQRAREISKYDALANRGYYIYGWDLEWHFSYKNQRPLFGGEEMARRVNLIYNSGHLVRKNKVVLLAHDFMWRSRRSVEELRIFIRIMKAQGWSFDTINNYIHGTPAVFVKNKASTLSGGKKLKKAQLAAKKAKLLKNGSVEQIITGKINTNRALMLSMAIKNQDFLKIRKLLSRGADINAKDPNGEIPLNIAIKTNNAVLVKLLVESGARVFNIDANGMSPMGIAKQLHNIIIIEYLKKQIDLQKQRRLKNILFAMNQKAIAR